MVLGLKNKSRKSPSVHLDYIIHIQEIKPWPPSQSLRSLRAVVIQWEHGEKTNGLTKQVVPSIGSGSGVGDGRIEFSDSFRLPVTLMREVPVKGGNGDAFQKNCIEFNLYEPRREKLKAQLLGTAVVDLADYGVVKEDLSVSAPINCKRTYRNIAQPFLLLKIQPFEKSRTSSASRDSLMREPSMDRNHGESVSALMSEEYAEEAEFITDDDGSSDSSLAVTSSAADSNGSFSPLKENETISMNDSAGGAKVGSIQAKNSIPDIENESPVNSIRKSSHSSSIDLSSDILWISKKIISSSVQSTVSEGMEKQLKSNEPRERTEVAVENLVNGAKDAKSQLSPEENTLHRPVTEEPIAVADHQMDKHLDSDSSCQKDDEAASPASVDKLLVAGGTNLPINGLEVSETIEKHTEHTKEKRIVEEKLQKIEDETYTKFSEISFLKQSSSENSLLSTARESFASPSSSPNIDRSKPVKSVRSSADLTRSNGSARSNLVTLADTPRGSISFEHKDAMPYRKETNNLVSDKRIQQFENKIKILEGELREAAAIEVSLYSVIAEHGSSMTKVHAPARRLLRLYFHAIKQNSKTGRRTAAKSVVSGLVLVAKACGNDVPRLTFWLSNSIALRAIVNKSFEESQSVTSVGPDGNLGSHNERNKFSSLKWESSPDKITRGLIEDGLGDWDSPATFSTALEKVEAWIFSRVVESLWWQSLTPHMQSGAATAIRRSMSSDSSKLDRTSSSIDQQQGCFSLELWKNAFRDACERICPVRAGGHDCGCLPVIPKLIMEQLIARLDVAMFNAILRESADEIPTDPVADPISDADVLPIPPGKASFGAGAQLKNAIGNWSRWLTDLFGIDEDDDDLTESEDGFDAASGGEQRASDASSKSFRLLNALSDLLMLPKDMLLSRTIRKEVCPAFGPSIIRRVLNFFTPDEFCPDPIPRVVIEALNSEDSFDPDENCITNFPCAAACIVYQAPSAASVTCIFGEASCHSKLIHSRSSVLKKSQTSDDELDELDSPLKGIITDIFQSSPYPVKPGWTSMESEKPNTVRYKLLKEAWFNSD